MENTNENKQVSDNELVGEKKTLKLLGIYVIAIILSVVLGF